MKDRRDYKYYKEMNKSRLRRAWDDFEIQPWLIFIGIVAFIVGVGLLAWFYDVGWD